MSTCPIIAIDPGSTQSGYCVIDRSTLRPLEFGKIDNAELLQKLSSAGAQGWRWAVIEMVESYGMSPSGGHSLTDLQTTTSKMAVVQKRTRISFTASKPMCGQPTLWA